MATAAQAHEDEHTRTPIKHVIVLIGENRTFDHLFATYVPRSGDSVRNLLSQGIVQADGSPGPRFSKAAQFQAAPPFQSRYFISLDANQKVPYQLLPGPTLNFSPNGSSPPPFPAATPAALLALVEPSLESADLHLLTTGASGALPSAPFGEIVQDGFFPLPAGVTDQLEHRATAHEADIIVSKAAPLDRAAKEIACAVLHYSRVGKLLVVLKLGKAMQHVFFPLAAGARSQLKDRAAAARACAQ